tara:strand:+ start:36 stop:392 length:357 start_codon:yes stop_codon:yes gene_type:complete
LKPTTDSANTSLLKLTQRFISSPESFFHCAALTLIADFVLTATQSIDGGSSRGEADATWISHRDAALHHLVYDCKINAINETLTIEIIPVGEYPEPIKLKSLHPRKKSYRQSRHQRVP